MTSLPETNADSGDNRGWPRGLGFFRPAPSRPITVTDPVRVADAYRINQRKILVATIVGYALFYFVRKNMSVAMPLLEKDLGITKSTLGGFLTAHGVVYGVSKFANGFLGDRCNGRSFMVAGLMACALINAAFAYSANLTAGMQGLVLGSSVLAWAFGLLWVLNGWFQGMGFPPCARLLTHWFPPKVLATRMSIWNTSHSLGTAGVLYLGGLMAKHGMPWQAQFYVPAGLALLGCGYLWAVLKDTPESMGLPPVETLPDKPDSRLSQKVDPETAEHLAASMEDRPKSYYMKQVFLNPYIWIISLANFFVYAVRYAILDWGPTLFSQAKHFDLKSSSWITTAYELAGIGGMLAAGWITDNVFGGRGARTCLFYMALCTAAAVLLWRLPLTSGAQAASVMMLVGFAIYGPQALVGIAVANLGTKHAAATAVGLTGLFGYLSTTVSGWGVGKVVDTFGWSIFFEGLLGFSIAGTLLFALAWGAPAHGYKK